MHTPCVHSKGISYDDEMVTFPLAAVTGTSGRSPTAFAAVSQLHSPNPTRFLEGCRQKGEGGWEVNVHVDYTS